MADARGHLLDELETVEFLSVNLYGKTRKFDAQKFDHLQLIEEMSSGIRHGLILCPRTSTLRGPLMVSIEKKAEEKIAENFKYPIVSMLKHT